MKKLVLWLIKLFKLDIVTEKVVTKTEVVYRDAVIKDSRFQGDLYVTGNLVITGKLSIGRGIAMHSGASVTFNDKEVRDGL